MSASVHLESLAAIARNLEERGFTPKIVCDDSQIQLRGTVIADELYWIIKLYDDRIKFEAHDKRQNPPKITTERIYELADPECFDHLANSITTAKTLADRRLTLLNDLKAYKDNK